MSEDRRSRRRFRRRGMTLMEVALATTIVGVSVVALMEVLASGMKANAQSQSTVIGNSVVNAVREHAVRLTAAQVIAMDGETFSPPIDAMGDEQLDLADWSQEVRVQKVAPDSLRTALPANASTTAYRVTVTAGYRGQRVCNLSWIVFQNP